MGEIIDNVRHHVARLMHRIAYWIDGSGWDYDEWDHGYREGLKAGKRTTERGRT